MNKSRGNWGIQALVLVVSMTLAGIAYAGTAASTRTTGGAQAASPTHSTNVGNVNAPSAGAMAFDLVLVRPLGLAATLIGTGLFIVNLPLSVFEKGAPARPFHRLVVEPARYTFTRPLGALN